MSLFGLFDVEIEDNEKKEKHKKAEDDLNSLKNTVLRRTAEDLPKETTLKELFDTPDDQKVRKRYGPRT